MTQAEKKAKAIELRKQGLLLREIVVEVGAPRSTVFQWIDDPDGSKLRERKRRYCGECVECGASTDGSNGYEAAAERCRACHDKRQARILGAAKLLRWEEAAYLRDQGMKNVEIAERMGVSTAAVASLIYRARRDGYGVATSPHYKA